MARNRRRTGRGTGWPPPAVEEEPVRLTVALAGRQDVAVTAFRGDGDVPGSVNVRLGRARLVFIDRAAAAFVATRWEGMAGLAGKLPAEFERSTPVASARTTEKAVAFRVPQTSVVAGRVVRPRGHTCWLQLQIGPVQFSVRDTTAFHTAAAGLRRAAQKAAATLPDTGPATSATAGASTEPMRARQTAARSVASALAAPPPDPAARTGAAGRSPGTARGAAPLPATRPRPGATPGAVLNGGGGR